FAPLSGLVGLTNLNLAGTDFTNCAPLAGLTNLVSLVLGPDTFFFLDDSGPTFALDCLASLRHLVVLDLASKRIRELSPLAGLTNLHYLNLDGNLLTNCTPLAGLINLTNLGLANSYALIPIPIPPGGAPPGGGPPPRPALTNIGCLASLHKLQQLNLSSHRISDVAPLSGLGSLTTLSAG